MVNGSVIKEIYAGFHPEGSNPKPILLQGISRAFLIFEALKMSEKGLHETGGTAILAFERCLRIRSGKPKTGGTAGHPLAGSKGLFEIESSAWIKEYQKEEGDASADRAVRHLVAHFPGKTFEFLCRDFNIKLDLRPKREIVEDLIKRTIDQ